MGIVLAATGLFLYLRFQSDLDRTIDKGLRTRAADVSALVQEAESGLRESSRSPLTEQGESFAQILDARGRIFDATPRARSTPLLSAGELDRAVRGTLIVDHRPRAGLGDPAFDESFRLLATPVAAQDRRLVVVVGASLEDRGDALTSLGGLLLIGGVVALLLASVAGFGVAAAALRPVEAMRRRAATISAEDPGGRLPVPPARDEIGRLGVTLNEMLARLELAFEHEREFVSNASHELRTPLAILRAELELALARSRTPGELEAALRSAREETDRLVQLAEDLLVLARSDGAKLPVHREEVEVAGLLGRVRDRFADRARSQGRAIVVEAPAGLRLSADAMRLEQALSNMVANGLLHGGGSIRLSAVEADGVVRIEVADEGPGIPEDFLPRAFERFTRADEARQRRGSGLGLAIVAAVARSHGGEAGASGAPGGGARVWMAIPSQGPPRA